MDDYPPIPPRESAPVAPPVTRVRAIPEGNHSVTPHLVVRNGARALDFYAQAFGAREIQRMPGPDGKSIMHAEMQIGDSRVYLADEFPAMGAKSPQALRGTPVTIHLYVEDADAAFDRAVAAGAKVRMPVADQFWGDRYGQVEDPFGHLWSIATHTEDLSDQEMMRRAAEAFAAMPPPPKPKAKARAAKKAAPKRKKKTAARKKKAVKKKKVARKKPARKKRTVKKRAAKKRTAKKKVARRKPARRKKAARKKTARKKARKPARRGAARKKKKKTARKKSRSRR